MGSLSKIKNAKITKLYEGLGAFFDRAISFSERGNYIEAVDVMFTAQRFVEPFSDEDLEIMIQLSDFYSEMGLFKESNRILFEAMGHAPLVDDIYFGLINNFVSLNQTDKVEFYINMGRYFGVFDDEYEDAIEELEKINSGSNLKLVKSESRNHLLSLAKQFMDDKSTTSFSHQIFTSLLEDESCFLEACNGLALLNFCEGDIDKGKEYCDMVLEKYPDDIDALSQKCAALSSFGDNEKAQEILEKLDMMEVTNVADYFKIVMCAVSVGNDGSVKKFTSKLLKKIPYDRDLLTLYAIACNNLGEYNEAAEASLKRCKLYQNEFEGRYFAKAIKEACENRQRISLAAIIDSETENQLSSSIISAMKNATADRFAKKLKADESLREALSWSVQGNVNLCIKALQLLTKSKEGYGYVNKVLCDPQVSMYTKQQVFYYACLNEKYPSVRILLSDILLNFSPSIPKVSDKKEFINAYFKAYSSMAFVTAGFDKKLNLAYKKLVKAFNAANADEIHEKLDENTMAAVLTHKANQCAVFSKPSYCCEVFRCKENDFMLYCKRYEDFFNADKGLKKKAQNSKKEDN